MAEASKEPTSKGVPGSGPASNASTVASCASAHIVEDPVPAVPAASMDTRSRQRGLVAVTLNIGGRNTNIFEFVLQGDGTPEGVKASQLQIQARDALNVEKCGPAALQPKVRSQVASMLDEIFADTPGRELIDNLLSQRTWRAVVDLVRRDCPGLFNALNLVALQLSRPSIFEAPETVTETELATYLFAWRDWYTSLDRAFWSQVSKKVEKHNISGPVGIAGILMYDLLCRSVAEHVFGASCVQEVQALSHAMPYTSFDGKHKAATDWFTAKGALIVLVQEAKELQGNPRAQADYTCHLAKDPFTCVLVRKDCGDVENLSAGVYTDVLDVHQQRFAGAEAKAWTTTISRTAVVRWRYQTGDAVGAQSTTVVAASMHCVRSLATADILESLKVVLESYAADLYLVGIDTNVSSKEAGAFQERLRGIGVMFGDVPEAEQVTVAKQRTMLQTQVVKADELDVAHKDYILSWGRAHRSATVYEPDLCSRIGLERSTGEITRLPTKHWPFDHCGVTAVFDHPD